jgi:hypothetical protein
MNIETKTTQEFRAAVIVDGVTICTCDDPGKAKIVEDVLRVAEFLVDGDMANPMSMGLALMRAGWVVGAIKNITGRGE